MQIIEASSAKSASGASAVNFANHTEVLTAAIFVLDVTAAGSIAGDLLNVYVQHSVDDGASWDDFVSFTQVLGNGGVKKFLAFWALYGTAPSTPMKAPQDGALTAGQVQQGPIGNTLRVKWAIVNGGGTHLFTFSLGIQQVEA